MVVALDDATLQASLAAVTAVLGRGARTDGWLPPVQGAVGHVVGVEGPDGQAWAAKVFPAGEDGTRRARTEATALRLAAGLPGVTVPGLVLHLRVGGPAVVVMTRLPGARWADRRHGLSAAELTSVHDAVAGLLAALHARHGGRFGDLLEEGRHHRDAWSVTAARAEDALTGFVAHGGPPGLARSARRHVEQRRHLFAGVRPVLCHHDVGGGNVLVAAAGAPRLTGLVDLERASWDDPLADVALTAQHLAHDHPRHVDALLDRYGVDDVGRERVRVHRVVLALAERAWVALDRPEAWETSARRLDGMLEQLLGEEV